MDFLQPFYKKDFIKQVYRVHDTSSNSPYVELIDMPTYIGGGVSLVKFYPSTTNLHTFAPFEVEVLDALGNAVRTEIPDFRDRFGNYYVSIYVQDSTAEGFGSISFVGVANATPDGEYIQSNDVNSLGYNLIIAKPLLIQPFERNESPLVFDRPPLVSVGQIIAPVRSTITVELQIPGTTDTNTKPITASFVTANVEGFDKVAATSRNIQDTNTRDFSVKNRGVSSTTNQVTTTVRQEDYNIQGGQLLTDTNRFRTILQLSSSLTASSNDKGAVVVLSDSNTYSNVTKSLSNLTVFAKTNPYNDLDLLGQTQSLASQLSQYTGTVIRVLNSASYLIDTPLQVNVDSSNITRKNSITQPATHTFRFAKDLRLTMKYADPIITVVSTTVSQSYLQFTFQELKPIGGSVYRIKSYYRQNSFAGDYQLLNDQRVGSTEYLTEAKEPNTLSYAKEISPFFLYGHFQNSSTISTYWKGYSETATTIDTLTINRDTANIIDSAHLPVTTPTTTTVFATIGYQLYQKDQAFSFSFICMLQPNTTLEVYANSKAMSTQLYDSNPFAQAYITTKNNEKARYPQVENRFGKYIGSIVNDTGKLKDYGRVIFDLQADQDGFGRPLFRVKSTDQTTTAGAYISEVSVTPLQRNGYTPEIYQYSINAPDGFQSLVSESVDFKFEYYDHTGKQSEYTTYINDIKLALSSEIQSNICQVENFKFVFNPTHWSIISESATYRNTFIAPYSGNPSTLYGGTSQPTSNFPYNDFYQTHSFAQIGSVTNANDPSIGPNVIQYVGGTILGITGWGQVSASRLALIVTASNIHKRRYFPAYDQMHAQLSFANAYGTPLTQPSSKATYIYSYGVGSTYSGTTPNEHTWSGWNALRPWKPIFAHRWLNKTDLTGVGTLPTQSLGAIFTGSFVYTSSWEIHPALGQSVRDNGSIAPQSVPFPIPVTVTGGEGVPRPTYKAASVTSSWRFFDEFSEKYSQVHGLAALVGLSGSSGFDYNGISASASLVTASFNRAVISASYTPGSGSTTQRLGTSSIDLQAPVNSGAAGITRFDVSQSYVTTSGAGFTTAQKAVAFKQRRFYFPFGGPLTGSVFTQNGGIYNVKFRLKRFQSGSSSAKWFSPDTGSYLMVYVFDVSTPFNGTSTEGQPGYYPPSQNIVKIGNQITTNGYNIPPIQFFDTVTGFLYDEYEINLIQYGTKGQLVFEPSGDPGSYFGCAIDDVEFCKIGTTTDPYYIKPPGSA